MVKLLYYGVYYFIHSSLLLSILSVAAFANGDDARPPIKFFKAPPAFLFVPPPLRVFNRLLRKASNFEEVW